MRALLAGSLGLALGLWAAGAAWAGDDPASGIQVLRPVAVSRAAVPEVTVDRPRALSSSAPSPAGTIQDRQLSPVSFSPAMLGWPRPIVRGQDAEAFQPLPSGLGTDEGPPVNDHGVKQPKGSMTEKPGPLPLTPAEPRGARNVPAPAPIPAGNGCDCCTDECGDCGDCCVESGCCGWLSRFCLPWSDGACVDEPYNWWFSSEYLLWWIKASPTPPLVTTSPVGTPRSLAGVLPGAGVLLGGDLDSSSHSGLRFTLGYWFDCDRTIGLEGSYFFLGERSVNFANASTGTPILARPFFNAVTGLEDSELVAFPNVLAGGVQVTASSRLTGADLNLRTNLWRGCCWRIDWLTGFRYLSLDESLNIMENLMPLAGSNFPAGSSIMVWDNFTTHNYFYGGQIGPDIEVRRGPWSLDFLAKVALGATHETSNINGATGFMIPGQMPSLQPGGLLALPTNIGHSSHDRFAVVPEIGVKLSYQVTPHLRAFVGYSFLYWSDVVRPGNQIDRVVNPTQLPGAGGLVGPARPTTLFHPSDFWAQGINLGLELRF